jgi:hypothetical protein
MQPMNAHHFGENNDEYMSEKYVLNVALITWIDSSE